MGRPLGCALGVGWDSGNMYVRVGKVGEGPTAYVVDHLARPALDWVEPNPSSVIVHTLLSKRTARGHGPIRLTD
jgi:hypothetical protein